MSQNAPTSNARRTKILVVIVAGLALIPAALALALLRSGPAKLPAAPADTTIYVDKSGDEELAYLLVRLEKRTRQVAAGHYGRSQSAVPGIDILYKRWLTKNGILPAAVADGIFSGVVPAATGGRAWVKMVVPAPRNPNNRGDETALDMMRELQGGGASADRSTAEAVYYGEPITATAACLRCHGEPAGAPDPHFPEFTKDGWKVGDIVGAVIARVAPEA